MRTDRPWIEIAQSLTRRPAKPQRLIEQEVPPGRILFRQWLAIVGAAFGLAGAGATLGSGAHRGANGAAISLTRDLGDPCAGGGVLSFIECGGETMPAIEGPPLVAVLTPSRRLDPTR